jgi:thiamine-phosphate pyrophosphorylase
MAGTGSANHSNPNDDVVRRCLRQQVQYAVEAQVDVVHIRERDLDAGELAVLVREAVAIAHGTRSRVMVNDRLDVALACGAGGVHLRGDSVPPAAVRGSVPTGFLVGRSVRNVEEAVAAAPHVDYLVAGTVWPSESKSQPYEVLGTMGLAAIVRAVNVPVLAIGGVEISRVAAVAASGAAGVAAIGLFLAPDARPRVACRATPLTHIVEVVRAQFDASR